MVQLMPNPSCAPAWLYVPMPDGSSSEPPVISPGPRPRKNRHSGPSSDLRGDWASTAMVLDRNLLLAQAAAREWSARDTDQRPAGSLVPEASIRLPGGAASPH